MSVCLHCTMTTRESFDDLEPGDIALMKTRHVGTNQANSAEYTGPSCPVCDEAWPCRVRRLIAMYERAAAGR
jgi:hypothetical protein